MSWRGEAFRTRMLALDAAEKDRGALDTLHGVLHSGLVAKRRGDTEAAHRWMSLAERILGELEQRSKESAA